jgi:hypothetical protein
MVMSPAGFGTKNGCTDRGPAAIYSTDLLEAVSRRSISDTSIDVLECAELFFACPRICLNGVIPGHWSNFTLKYFGDMRFEFRSRSRLF